MSPHFAWPTYRYPWACKVVGLRFDGQDAPVDNDYLQIDAVDRTWSNLEITLSASTDQSPPTGVENLRGHALVTCIATNLRRPMPLTLDRSSTAITGTLTIPRSIVARKALITVEIVGDVSGRPRLIGSGQQWSLILDKAEAPIRHGVPPVKHSWIDFADAAAPQEAQRNKAAHAYLDVTTMPPVLYLNSGIDGLQGLLESETAKNERRRHRDLVGAQIARYVAATLFRTAVEQVVADDSGGPPEGPGDSILRSMCEAVASQVSFASDADDLYQHVTRVREGSASSIQFWTEVDLALDRLTSLSSVIAKVSEEVKHA